MSSFALHIVTPEREVYSGPAQLLNVRTIEGDIGILKNHLDLVSPIGIGPIKVVFEDGSQRLGAIAGGFVRVTKEKTTVVASTLEWKDEIDLERAKQTVEKAKNYLKEPYNDREQRRFEVKLQKALNRIRIAEHE